MLSVHVRRFTSRMTYTKPQEMLRVARFAVRHPHGIVYRGERAVPYPSYFREVIREDMTVARAIGWATVRRWYARLRIAWVRLLNGTVIVDTWETPRDDTKH